MKESLAVLLTILLFWFFFNLLLEPLFEQSMVYFPFPELEQNPKMLGIDYEDVFIKTADGVSIHGWFIEDRDSDKVILYLHGNGGNISHRLPVIEVLHDLPVNVLMIDYHGYGRSGGRPSEKNLYLDAEAAYAYLIEQRKYLPSQIILMGRSIGGAVAVHLAVKEKVGGVIFESTFTSAPDMARNMLFLFVRPLFWIRSEYNTLEKVGLVKAPKLFVHSKKDEIIPYQMTEVLYEKAAEPKKILLLDHGGHNDFVFTPEYIAGLREIIGGFN